MEVDAADLSRGPIVELGRHRLGDRVVPLLLPTAHKVEPVLQHAPLQLGNFIGTVLQVGVHGDDHLAANHAESGVERGTLALIAGETQPHDPVAEFRLELLHNVP